MQLFQQVVDLLLDLRGIHENIDKEPFPEEFPDIRILLSLEPLSEWATHR